METLNVHHYFNMEFFKTQKGGSGCIYRGFEYRFGGMSLTRKRWRCLKEGCYGKLNSNLDDTDPQESCEHNHPPNPEKIAVKKAIKV